MTHACHLHARAQAHSATRVAGQRAGSRHRVPDDPRRAHARRQRASQSRDVRQHVDGASGGAPDDRVLRQEHDRGTAPRARSSRRSSTRRSNGTSGSLASPRSTPRATSTGSCIREWAGSCGVTPSRCRRTSSSGSTTSATACRRSRSTSRARARRSSGSTTTSCGSASTVTARCTAMRGTLPLPCLRGSPS
jgi:hypothetical protein